MRRRPPSAPAAIAAAVTLAAIGVQAAADKPGSGGPKPPREEPKATLCSVGFTTHAGMVAALEALAAARPDIARIEDLGTSVRGRRIVGLRIGDDAPADGPEPAARVIGAIHGNECMSFEVPLALARALVEGHGSDPRATFVVDEMETLVVPMANPDGVAASRRANANGVDLNRNLPLMWVAGESSGAPLSEPETRALRDDALRRPYAVGISYHTVANYLNLVWNYTPVAPRHERELRALWEPYAAGTSYAVVLGWHWYSVYGEFTDWSYGTRGTLDAIVEIQSDFGRAAQTALHVPRAIELLARAAQGIGGLVVDAGTGRPLEASVWVEQRRAPVFTGPDRGDFHASLVAGTYDLTVRAPGYVEARVEGVAVPPDGRARVDVALRPGGVAWAFAVVGAALPRAIRDASYPNRSVPSDALGPADGAAYALEPGGTVTLDLGFDLADRDGPDLRIHAGPGAEGDRCDVEVSTEPFGPWTRIGGVLGTGDIDVAAAGVSSLRYVRITDRTGGRFGTPGAGYDLDAVEVLDSGIGPGGDGDADADAGADADADGSADTGEDEFVDGGDAPNGDEGADAADAGPDGTPEDGDAVEAGDASDRAGSAAGCGCAVSCPASPPPIGCAACLAALALRPRRRRSPAREEGRRAVRVVGRRVAPCPSSQQTPIPRATRARGPESHSRATARRKRRRPCTARGR
ncbi:MAG: M14 family zinc carboxypeptidase, partial [Myxococcota bacterium]|nr:M14 family zinc carboxypeptidase [Myxococcota bacterium]